MLQHGSALHYAYIVVRAGKEQLSFKQGDVISLKRVPPGEGWGLGKLNGKVCVLTSLQLGGQKGVRLIPSAFLRPPPAEQLQAHPHPPRIDN